MFMLSFYIYYSIVKSARGIINAPALLPNRFAEARARARETRAHARGSNTQSEPKRATYLRIGARMRLQHFYMINHVSICRIGFEPTANNTYTSINYNNYVSISKIYTKQKICAE